MNAGPLRWVLLVSLCLNLFLGGFLVARAVYHVPFHHHAREFHGPFIGPRAMMRNASGPAGDAMRAALRRHAGELRAQRQRLGEARRAVRAALVAEPFDAQALARAFSDLRGTTTESQRLMHQVLLEVAGTLPAAERRELLPDGPPGMPHGAGGL